jgi:hypothetical protein
MAADAMSKDAAVDARCRSPEGAPGVQTALREPEVGGFGRAGEDVVQAPTGEIPSVAAEALQWPGLRVDRHEVEAATKGRVDQRDGSVGGVHGDDEPEIAWQLERLVGPVERADLLAPVLEE